MKICRRAKIETKIAIKDDDGRRLLPALGENVGTTTPLPDDALPEVEASDELAVTATPPASEVEVEKLLGLGAGAAAGEEAGAGAGAEAGVEAGDAGASLVTSTLTTGVDAVLWTTTLVLVIGVGVVTSVDVDGGGAESSL